MFALKKRYFVLGAAIAGLVYGAQFYTVTGWQQLRLVPRQESAAPSANEQAGNLLVRDNRAWNQDGKQANLSTPASYASNSSFPSTGNSKPLAIPSTTARVNGLNGTQSTRLVVAGLAPTRPDTPTVRIASFNLQAFGDSKINKLAVVEIIARIIRQFDVVAIQDISSRQRDTLPRLVEKINQSDRRYDYCIGPRVGNESVAQQFAFVFDTDRIETDRQQLYTVDDPQGLMEFDPLVGWFRSKMASDQKAFTFTLVNLRISPPNSDKESKLLPDLLKSIRQDGRSEDDIIFAGDFGCADNKLGALRNLGMLFALEGVTTTVAGDEMLDNIVFPARATDEFTGRSGTVDFLRHFNLTPDQAFQVSSHMPVWAEFFAVEGGLPGYVAQ